MPTILIVADDLKLLKMLQRQLGYEDMNLLTASNGQEALHIIQASALTW